MTSEIEKILTTSEIRDRSLEAIENRFRRRGDAGNAITLSVVRDELSRLRAALRVAVTSAETGPSCTRDAILATLKGER